MLRLTHRSVDGVAPRLGTGAVMLLRGAARVCAEAGVQPDGRRIIRMCSGDVF